MDLIPPSKCVVLKTQSKGWGVFAIEPIQAEETIEECPLVIICDRYNFEPHMLADYRFNYPSGTGNDDWIYQVIPAGYGPIYNHSDDNNAYWYNHPEKELVFVYKAKRDIPQGQEICTYYGPQSYWESHGRDKVEKV